MRAILAGGGTGGHVIPALAIAQQLQQEYGSEILFIGTAKGLENRLVPAAGFELKLIKVGALKNVALSTRFKTLGDVPRAVLQARRIFAQFRPDVVIGVGGYASGPAMLAATVQRIPTLAFEPNAVPGLANRLVARSVSAAAVHFPQTAHYFRRARVTGVPVRQAFFEIGPPPLNGTGPTVLAFGGSQGAHTINLALAGCVAQLRAEFPQLKVIHQSGEADYNELAATYQDGGLDVQLSRFIEDMPACFKQADLVICRSGASTVAELAAAGRGAILIPFPRAADDHQKRNAEALVHAGAAEMIEESQLTPMTLAGHVGSLLRSPERLQALSAAAHKLAHPNAAGEIAGMAAQLVRKR